MRIAADSWPERSNIAGIHCVKVFDARQFVGVLSIRTFNRGHSIVVLSIRRKKMITKRLGLPADRHAYQFPPTARFLFL